jgi:hypothetical protein
MATILTSPVCLRDCPHNSPDTRGLSPWFNDITAVSLAFGTGVKDDLTPGDDPPATIQTGANTVNIMKDG